MPQIEVLMALGQIGFNGCIKLLRDKGFDVPKLKFGHGVHYPVSNGSRTVHLTACYHPSRQNTQTGRLTQQMLNDVFVMARSLLQE